MSDQSNQKRIIRLDASALRKSKCPLAFKRIVIDGYREPTLYNDTLYGTAFHLFPKVMYETNGDLQAATKAALEKMKQPCRIRPKKDHLTENHLLKTCFDFWENFIEKDTQAKILINPATAKPFVEVQFDILVYECNEFEIRISGTIDKLVQITNGCVSVGDYKTTSSWDIQKYLRQFRTSPQLKLYVWAIKKLGTMYPDGPFAALVNRPIGAFIDGVFLKSKLETEFVRSEVFIFKQQEMDEFKGLLDYKINQLASLIEEEGYIYPLGKIEGTCNDGFPCEFCPVCFAPDDIAAEHVLRNNFKAIPYNPLTFGEN